MKRLFLPLLITLSMFTASCDDDSITNPVDVPITVTESELKEAFYYTFPLMYGAQNEAYMCRSAENVVRGLCFNELGVSG